jgi:hypothetical protein
VDLDEVADELYQVPPEEFVATRKARQDEAKSAGDPVLAKQIGGLPKPSTAAWLTNVLVRAQRPEIEGLVELGGLLREAQENLAGDQLRTLNAQRGQLLSALTRQAQGLAHRLGHPVTSAVATQVEETLRAAMADPDVGEAVLSGRLTSPLSYSGMGTGARPDLRLVRTPAPERPAAKPAGRGARAQKDRAETDRHREEEARRAAAERRRQELADARAAAAEATRAAEEAETAVEAEKRSVAELRATRDELRDRAADLREELTRLEEQAVQARADLERAERHSRGAQRTAAAAAAARDRALARVRELESADR